jgi:hypothetical protein
MNEQIVLVLVLLYFSPNFRLKYSVTEQRVTAQWSYVVSDPDFCDHHWFGYA